MLGRLGVVSSACLALYLLTATPARAVTFDVNSFDDQPDVVLNGFCVAANGFCTLRAAIMESANVDTVVNLPSGLYPLSAQIIVAADPDALNSLELRGAGARSTIVDAGDNGRHFDLSLTVNKPVTLSGLTLRNGQVTGGTSGGSITSSAVLMIEDCIIEGNSAIGGSGGGIAVVNSQMFVRRSTIRGNSAWFGGGIKLASTAPPSAVIDSTISGNASTYDGGGIWIDSGLFLQNSTLSGNSSGDNGGGINNFGTVSTFNVTIANNQAASDGNAGLGGGVYNEGNFNLNNSVLGGNFVGTVGNPDLDDCNGGMNTTGFNKFFVFSGCVLTHGGACGGTDTQLGSLAYLGPLQSNGGPTETHAIRSDSDLRNAVVSPCPCVSAGGLILTVDQRGGVRPVETSCDIGAFEYGGLLQGLIFADGFATGDRTAW